MTNILRLEDDEFGVVEWRPKDEIHPNAVERLMAGLGTVISALDYCACRAALYNGDRSPEELLLGKHFQQWAEECKGQLDD